MCVFWSVALLYSWCHRLLPKGQGSHVSDVVKVVRCLCRKASSDGSAKNRRKGVQGMLLPSLRRGGASVSCRLSFESIYCNVLFRRTIVENNLFQPGDRVAIGASGGKGKGLCAQQDFLEVPLDSTVLAYVMKLLNERHNYGLELFLLSIDEGITGYRDDSLEVCQSARPPCVLRAFCWFRPSSGTRCSMTYPSRFYHTRTCMDGQWMTL